MRKMQKDEMKSVKAGADPALVECVCAFMDAGWDFSAAADYCEDVVFGDDT